MTTRNISGVNHFRFEKGLVNVSYKENESPISKEEREKKKKEEKKADIESMGTGN